MKYGRQTDLFLFNCCYVYISDISNQPASSPTVCGTLVAVCRHRGESAAAVAAAARALCCGTARTLLRPPPARCKPPPRSQRPLSPGNQTDRCGNIFSFKISSYFLGTRPYNVIHVLNVYIQNMIIKNVAQLDLILDFTAMFLCMEFNVISAKHRLCSFWESYVNQKQFLRMYVGIQMFYLLKGHSSLW